MTGDRWQVTQQGINPHSRLSFQVISIGGCRSLLHHQVVWNKRYLNFAIIYQIFQFFKIYVLFSSMNVYKLFQRSIQYPTSMNDTINFSRLGISSTISMLVIISMVRPLLTVDPNQNPKTFFGLVLVLVNWRKNDAIGFWEILNAVNHPSTVT